MLDVTEGICLVPFMLEATFEFLFIKVAFLFKGYYIPVWLDLLYGTSITTMTKYLAKVENNLTCV